MAEIRAAAPAGANVSHSIPDQHGTQRAVQDEIWSELQSSRPVLLHPAPAAAVFSNMCAIHHESPRDYAPPLHQPSPFATPGRTTNVWGTDGQHHICFHWGNPGYVLLCCRLNINDTLTHQFPSVHRPHEFSVTNNLFVDGLPNGHYGDSTTSPSSDDRRLRRPLPAHNRPTRSLS